MKTLTIEEFTQKTASSDPVPGGGSISALAGALAAALAEMVAGLTLGKAKYQDVEALMEDLAKKAEALKTSLLDDIERDSKSFQGYMDALTMPKNTEEEKAARTAAMQDGLKAAAEVPFSVAKTAAQILPFAKTVIEKGNSFAVTDGLVSAMMARTAVLGALYNVKINLGSIQDQAYVAKMKEEVLCLEQKVKAMEGEILKDAEHIFSSPA